jgi:hypothetical protein
MWQSYLRRLLAVSVRAALIALLAFATGCNQPTEEEAAIDIAHRYAELPGLKATTHKGLRDELARLIDERATPKLLDEARDAALADAYRLTTVAADIDDSAGPRGATIDWQAFFAPRKLEDVAARVDRIYPDGPLKLHPAVLRTAIELRTQHEPQRQRLRRLLSLGYALQWKHAEGLLAEASDTTVLRICSRLEGLAVAEALNDGRPEAALASVRTMFAAAERLAIESRVVSRIVAVQIRADALGALAAVLDHPAAGDKLRREAALLIDAQLQRWPHDRLAWQGDRAAGLHTYELIRDGGLMTLLTGAEKVRFKQLGVYQDLEQSVAQNIDADEMYYLSAMRRLIAVSEKPHHQRIELLQAIRQELLELHQTAQYPVVADTMLLADFEQGFRLQALDRARMEAWQLALRAAETSPAEQTATLNPTVNSLTGEPFVLSIENSHVVVDGIDPDRDELISLPANLP